jgi:predicted dienelactone hydrolase
VNRLSRVLGTILLAGACACVQKGGPRLELPQPTGPFGVGTMGFSFTDPARPETFTADPDDHREVTVRLWYPAVVGRSDKPCPYAEPGTMMAEQGFSDEAREALTRLDERLSSLRTHSVKNAPVAEGGPYPVVIYSHGYWAGMNQSTVLMEELASHGYIAASIGHSFETNNITRPDGRIVRFDPRNPEFMLRGRERQASQPLERAVVETADPDGIDALFREIMKARPKTMESLAIWAADISFVIDKLREMDREDGRFRGRFDLDGVGVVGHSFGGAASGQAGLNDPRVAAGINLDGLQLGDMVDRAIGIPFLFVHHDNRTAVNPTPNINLFRRAKGPAYLLVIEGTGHYNFSDFSLPLLSEGIPLPQGALGSIDGRRCADILNGIVVTFFDVYLRDGDVADLTKLFERYPEIEVVD